MLHKIAILITVLFLAKTTAQTNVYFSEKNSQAIRDSINSIKYVNPDKTIEFIFEVLENYSEKRPNLTISSAYMVLSELYQFKGLPDQTVEYLNLAQQEYEKLFKEIPPWQKINMGNSFYGAGRFDKAKELYREAFKIFEQKLLNAGDDIAKQKAQRFGLAVSTNNIGLVERDMENYELAEIQFLKGLEIRKKNLGWGDIAHSYANLTLIYLRWDKLDKVVLFADSTKFALKKYFLPGEKNATTISTYNRYYGLVQWYLGTRMSKLNQKKEALSYYDSAEKYFINNTVGLSDIIYVRSKSLIHFGDLKAALSSVNKGLQLSEEEGFFDDQRRFLKMKTELLASIGDYKSSKETADKLLILNEKKLLNKNNDIFNSVSLKSSLRKKEKELLIESKIRQQLIFLFSLIILILGMIIILFRNKNIISKQKEVISKKDKKIAEVNLVSAEKELRYVTKSILEKNEMLESIKKDVDYVSSFVSESHDIKHAINPLVSKLEDATSGDTEWSKFQHTFRKAYPGFIEQFLKVNSTLTVQDLRLSIYLKSGHTTNEIATLTGLSIRSIESRRHRLRKKLDLDKSIDLITYIMSLSSEKSSI
ncbi:MAG: tetratricopeptide repeat protein [Fidelibacterota bacterium]|jgi:tetratricopeptide (TPR) repeat protein|tara:strand:- start:1467 stop:3245 length:1779 start_codon:yes stop_codon:yes gene_type:complete